MKRYSVRQSLIIREALNLAIQCIFADDVQVEAHSCVAYPPRGSQERFLIFDTIQAGDVN